jgi:hypothetical protein
MLRLGNEALEVKTALREGVSVVVEDSLDTA